MNPAVSCGFQSSSANGRALVSQIRVVSSLVTGLQLSVASFVLADLEIRRFRNSPPLPTDSLLGDHWGWGIPHRRSQSTPHRHCREGIPHPFRSFSSADFGRTNNHRPQAQQAILDGRLHRMKEACSSICRSVWSLSLNSRIVVASRPWRGANCLY